MQLFIICPALSCQPLGKKKTTTQSHFNDVDIGTYLEFSERQKQIHRYTDRYIDT